MTEEKINQEEEVVNDSAIDNEPVADEETVKKAAKEAEEPAEEKDPLEAAKAEIEELKTQMLYKTAEFDNYRKRTLKEKAELILNGGEKAVSAVLPIIDDMERAIENGAKTDDPAVLREGMELIYNKFIKALEGLGVKKIDTTDADFDTDMHEAVTLQQSYLLWCSQALRSSGV
jgi:molecular chaperone GrpE